MIPRQRTGPSATSKLRTGGVTVIVPTRNESGNVGSLMERLDLALEGRDAEVIFVDDSDDDTPRQVLRVGRTSELPVRLHHRSLEDRAGGLGSAVTAGLTLASTEWVVVMDGDLQHPPELVPALVSVAESRGVDVVVASRHAEGGSEEGLSGLVRLWVSRLSIFVAKLVFPSRLRGVSDPMSGFFLVRPAAVDVSALRPRGFKILLEILARTPGLSRQEVPFSFGERLCGESKASLREGFRFVRQLVELWLDTAARERRFVRVGPAVVTRGALFAAVGATGLLVNTLLMWLLVDGALGISYVVAAIVATQLSTTWNFALADVLVYPGPKRFTRTRRWLAVMGLSNAVLVLRVPLLALLVSGLGVHYLIANFFTLFLGFLARFTGQERLSLVKETA